MNKDCRKFGRKNFGKLKSICIGNDMEIVKIGKKLGNLLQFAKFTKFFLPLKYFTVQYGANTVCVVQSTGVVQSQGHLTMLRSSV